MLVIEISMIIERLKREQPEILKVQMDNKLLWEKFNLLVYFFALTSFLLFLWAIFKQPLWGDELYTIYFAKTTSSVDLLTNFIDSDTGVFYIYVKLLLIKFNNPVALRFFASLLPFFLAGLILFFSKNLRNKRVIIPLILFFSFLNPFIVHVSWQLRTYGLVLFFCSLAYVLFSMWVNKRDFFLLLVLGVVLAAGGAFHQSLLIFAFFLWFYIIFHFLNTSFVKRLILIFFIGVTIFTELKLLASVNLAEQYKSGNWIAIPNFRNIPDVLATSWGLAVDVHANNNKFTFYDFVFYLLVLCALVMIFFFFKKLVKNKRFVEIIYLVFLPYVSIIVTSYVLPRLSAFENLGSIIPNTSIFLPRVFLPFTLILTLNLALIFSSIYKENSKARLFLFFGLLSLIFCLYVFNNWRLNFKSIYASSETVHETESILSNVYTNKDEEFYIWPSIFDGVDPATYKAGFLADFIAKSKDFAKNAQGESVHDNLLNDCNLPTRATVYVRKNLEFVNEFWIVNKYVGRCFELKFEDKMYKIWVRN